MPAFLVRWEIDVDAVNARAAAQKGLEIQRDPESIATIFEVSAGDGETVTIDLLENDEADGVTHRQS